MNELRRAARDVFHGYFGRWWPLAVVIVAAIIFAPSIVFWKHVRLDIPKLVEEWTKLGISTVFLFFLLEIVSRRRDLNHSDERYRVHISTHVLGPLLRLQDDLQLHLSGLADTPSRRDGALVMRMRATWQNLVREISVVPVSHLDRPWPSSLSNFNYERDESLLEAILQADSHAGLDPDEQRELEEHLRYLGTEIGNYLSSKQGMRS